MRWEDCIGVELRGQDLPGAAEQSNPSRWELEAELRRREVDSPELRGSEGGLAARFVQLERAFSVNLGEQRRRELEMVRLRRENQELRCFNEQNTRIKVEMATSLSRTTEEKNYWRKAFVKQKQSARRYEADCKNTMASIKEECEEILRQTRKSTEEHFRQLVNLYENSREKVKHLEDQVASLRADQRTNECRAYELANLLETLERFPVNVNSVCDLTANALKSLTSRGNAFEVDLKALRRLSWTSEGKPADAEDVRLLRTQNSVFREVIKSLKRKSGEVAVRDGEPQTEENGQTVDGLNNHPWPACNKSREKSGINDCQKDTVSGENANVHGILRSGTLENAITRKNVGNNQDRKLTGESCDRSAESKDPPEKHILPVETHLNGTLFEEYVIRFSENHEMRLKHCPQVSRQLSHLKLEFVDNEDDYQEGSLDNLLIFLTNVYTVVKYQKSGINCGTQTRRTKFSTSCTQTATTGIEKYSRLNAGRTMLNSEKRAIERSLHNLERTVASLKCNALGQARSMIGKDSKLLGNDEFFECIKALTR